MRMSPAGRTRPQKVQKSLYCLVLCLAAFATLARGCGDEQHRADGTPDSEHAKEVGRNPYSLTCGDLARQSHPEGARLVIRAQAALTREPALRRRVRELGLQRANQSVYFALTEVCKGRDPSFKPARLTVERVRSGHLSVAPVYRSRLLRGGALARGPRRPRRTSCPARHRPCHRREPRGAGGAHG
jgi:hypothetical protein